MIRVNIYLDPELHTRLKVVAAARGVTIQAYIEQAIERKVGTDLSLVGELIE
jgi:predicted HicB family RNase H-like nuclease